METNKNIGAYMYACVSAAYVIKTRQGSSACKQKYHSSCLAEVDIAPSMLLILMLHAAAAAAVFVFLICTRALFGYRMEMVSDPWPDVVHAPTTYTLTSCFGPKEDVLMFRCVYAIS